jgi:hypothetical protein
MHIIAGSEHTPSAGVCAANGLIVIDIFSRFAWVKPLKSKRGDEITDVFTEIFKKDKPVKIQFDDGK